MALIDKLMSSLEQSTNVAPRMIVARCCGDTAEMRRSDSPHLFRDDQATIALG